MPFPNFQLQSHSFPKPGTLEQCWSRGERSWHLIGPCIHSEPLELLFCLSSLQGFSLVVLMELVYIIEHLVVPKYKPEGFGKRAISCFTYPIFAMMLCRLLVELISFISSFSLATKYSKIGFADSEFAPSLLTHSWTSITYKLDITTWIEVMYWIGSARSAFQITFENRFNDAESV